MSSSGFRVVFKQLPPRQLAPAHLSAFLTCQLKPPLDLDQEERRTHTALLSSLQTSCILADCPAMSFVSFVFACWQIELTLPCSLYNELCSCTEAVVASICFRFCSYLSQNQDSVAKKWWQLISVNVGFGWRDEISHCLAACYKHYWLPLRKRVSER